MRRLSGMATLAPQESSLIQASRGSRERWAAGREIELQGDGCRKPRVVLNGWACRQRVRPSGSRQIFDIVLPGDFIGHDRGGAAALATTTALTAVETVDMSTLSSGPEAGLALRKAIESARAEGETRLHDHLMRLGRLPASERTAHLLLELHDRLARIGLAHEWRFPLPLTQEMLADVLGLSVVHVNRTLQQLRREGMIEMRLGQMILLQPNALSSLADYVPVHRV